MDCEKRILCLRVAIFLVGCHSDSYTFGVGPAADAKRALAQGDRRLVGYMGYALVVPGTPPGFQYWAYSPGIKIVSKVTDTSPRGEIEKVDDYATRYNRIILDGAGGTP